MNIFKQKPKSDPLLDQLLRQQAQQQRQQRRIQRRQRWQQRRARVLSFLSHGAWQGIGGIVGILSFIVTIVLTLYIFNVGKEQQTAHVSKYVTNVSGGGWHGISINIDNNGPAPINDLVLRVIQLNENIRIISCRTQDVDINKNIKTTSFTVNNVSYCEMVYGKLIFPSQSVNYVVEFEVNPQYQAQIEHTTSLPEKEEDTLIKTFSIDIVGSNIKMIN